MHSLFREWSIFIHVHQLQLMIQWLQQEVIWHEPIQELQKTIQQRVAEQATLNVVSPHQIPKDLVTASGSGPDPEIGVQAAMIQAKRIAAGRNVSEQDILTLIAQHTRYPTVKVGHCADQCTETESVA